MKKIGIVLGIFLSLFIMACEGPRGLDGFDGKDGVNILGKVVDVEGSFNASNDYSIIYNFPNTIEVFETDVVLVYILWDQTTDSNGEPVDIWRLLPQTRILDQGILQYNYDHTFSDVSIFMEADFNMNTLTTSDTDNQVFRIAFLPANEAQSSKLNTSDIKAVMQTIGTTNTEVAKIKLQ
ncbi:collagen-like protein [uncultured Maribacter sp.]|uniref:collagen-like protein n=1 Tax=uncultured Maribacter sp. TaxID=431308 RepID=UPI00260ED784|nr:collagen-like protein [uncultured Maribacter sp.]